MSWWEDRPPEPGTPGLYPEDGAQGRSVFGDALRPTGILSADGSRIYRKPAFGFGACDEYVVLRGDPFDKE